MNRTHTHPFRRTMAAILATVLGTAPMAHAGLASLQMQAPLDLDTGAFDLDDVAEGNYGPKTAYRQIFAIDYPALEKFARQQLQETVDRTISGKVVCDDPCPDVDYSVSISTEFAFTQPGQPILHSFGNAAENGVGARLDAQVWIKLNVHARAETWFDSADVDIPLEVWLGAHGAAAARLWPAVDVLQHDVNVTLDGSNVEIQGLNGEAIELGAKLGAAIGFTPVGLFTGGPLGAAIIGAIGGDVAADVAKDRMIAIISQKLDAAIVEGNKLLRDQIGPFIFPVVAQANATKDRLLNTPLPGVRRSLNDLQADWGMSLDVRTVVQYNELRTVVGPRFSAAPNGGSLNGVVRMPKTRCQYAVLNHPIIGYLRMPTGVLGNNEDLAGQVGLPCDAVLGANAVTSRTFLGDNPEDVLTSGDPRNVMPRFTPARPVAFTGALEDKGNYYECSFTAAGLARVGIEELQTNRDLAYRITELHPDKERAMHVPSPYGLAQVALNSELMPYGLTGVLLGGKGPRSIDDCPTEGQNGTGWQRDLDLDFHFDPETCPQCGIERFFGPRGEEVFSITNPAPVLEQLMGIPAEELDAMAAAMPAIDLAPEAAAPDLGAQMAAPDVGAVMTAPDLGAQVAAPTETITQAAPAVQLNQAAIFQAVRTMRRY